MEKHPRSPKRVRSATTPSRKHAGPGVSPGAGGVRGTSAPPYLRELLRGMAGSRSGSASETAVAADGWPKDPLPEGSLPEDPLPEDALPKGSLPEDALPEEPLPEGPVAEALHEARPRRGRAAA